MRLHIRLDSTSGLLDISISEKTVISGTGSKNRFQPLKRAVDVESERKQCYEATASRKQGLLPPNLQHAVWRFLYETNASRGVTRRSIECGINQLAECCHLCDWHHPKGNDNRLSFDPV
jgi:hypothetical protein